MGLENHKLKIGFIPLTDAAPIIMAKENNFFADVGLEVTLEKAASWATIRERVATGLLDGAQMLAPMVLATRLGIEKKVPPFVTALPLSLNGNAITVSNKLYAEMQEADAEALAIKPMTARALHAAAAKRLKTGKPTITLAMVFPFSSHNYQLRYWLAAAGLHPDRDIRMVVVSPSHMATQLKQGAIDGYCVGEPWNTVALASGIGKTLITSKEIWGTGPEKVFGVTQKWAQSHPYTHAAILKAILKTTEWLKSSNAQEKTVRTLSDPKYLNLPESQIAPSLLRSRAGRNTNQPDFNVFDHYSEENPWTSSAIWFLTQMYRWGQLTTPVDIQSVAATTYLQQDWDLNSRPLQPNHPTCIAPGEAPSRTPFGKGHFIDGLPFNPKDPVSYIESFERHSLRTSLPALWESNSYG